MSTRPFLVAQISDLHLTPRGELAYGRVDTVAALEVCVTAISRLRQRPDALIATGDLAENAHPFEYALLAELLAPLLAPLDLPVYLMPGNHDARETLLAAFPDHAHLRQCPPFIQYAVDAGPLRIVALDTLIPGRGRGELCAARLEWLDRTLAAAPARPTLLLLHHPPFRTHIGHMDAIGLVAGGAELEAIVARNPQVERVLCGHLHRPIQTRFGGTLAMTSPSPAHQVALDLAPDGPAEFIMEPPGFLLHAWSEATGVVTHQVAIGAHEGPYPFD